MVSRLAKFWSGTALLAFLLAMLVSRAEIAGAGWIVILLVSGWISALLGLLLALIASLTKRQRRAAIFVAGLSALLVAAPMISLLRGRDAPPIHDISTDLENPPAFRAALDARPAFANPLNRKTPPDLAKRQREAYPDLVPLRFAATKSELFRAAKKILKEEGLRILSSAEKDGHLEGVAQTPLMGYKDDIVLRIREIKEGGALMDMRSVSRIGVSDLGANARRIRKIRARLKNHFGKSS